MLSALTVRENWERGDREVLTKTSSCLAGIMLVNVSNSVCKGKRGLA